MRTDIVVFLIIYYISGSWLMGVTQDICCFSKPLIPCSKVYDYFHVWENKGLNMFYNFSKAINLVSGRTKNQSQDLTRESIVEPFIYIPSHLFQYWQQ